MCVVDGLVVIAVVFVLDCCRWAAEADDVAVNLIISWRKLSLLMYG